MKVTLSVWTKPCPHPTITTSEVISSCRQSLWLLKFFGQGEGLVSVKLQCCKLFLFDLIHFAAHSLIPALSRTAGHNPSEFLLVIPEEKLSLMNTIQHIMSKLQKLLELCGSVV